MNKKTAKRQRDLKTKLMAAVAMLLVSSLMMVTSTYAWFTLSTAPEVTGIQTAVGANGNLEMALLNPSLQDGNGKLHTGWGDMITSGTQDSMDAAGRLMSEANKTWGNLVDVSDGVTYGLNNITLYPSALASEEATDANGNPIVKIKAEPLSRPVYGADGRVADLRADTLTASYVSGLFSKEGALGVRAVGTASSMTAREMAHRNALKTASDYTSYAKGKASSTLRTNGNVLAGMAIAHVGGTEEFSYSQVNALKTVIVELQKAHQDIENAMKWYIVAHNIAPSVVTDATYLAIQDGITSKTLAQIAADTSIEKPAGFADTGEGESLVKGAYSTLTASQANVSTALNKLNSTLTAKGESGTYAWSDISEPLNLIMNYDSMRLNGLTMGQVTEKTEDGKNYKNASIIINAMGKEGLQLQMGSGTGVIADIADFCGLITASITFPTGTSVMGVDIGGVEATMTTEDVKNPTRNPTWLADMRNATNSFTASVGAEETKSITDFYGYIIDLAFRTNASGSNLLLQADAIDRIYGEDGNNTETMGHGSTMTFTATDTFALPKVKALMSSLRIVFFDPDDLTIIGYAKLNNNEDDVVEDGNDVTMEMAMCDSTWTFKTGTDANVITELAQNEAKAISVLVYLDGNSVKNKDVAFTGTSSMTGSMNLQFASSAELKPMDYADLKDGKSEAETPQTITLTKVDVDDATAADGIGVLKAIGGKFGTKTGFGVIFDKEIA